MAWTPDAATASVFATLILNGIIGTIFLILFELWRNSNVEVYAPRLRTMKEYTIDKPDSSLFGWFKQVWNVDDSDLLYKIGLDGYVFLRFLKMCTRIGGCCCLFLVFLFPVYYTSSGNAGSNGISLFSMANIPSEGDRLWASWLFTYIFTIIFLYFMHLEYEHFAAVRRQYFREGDPSIHQQKNYSVQVENIPFEFRSTKKLREFFEGMFPNEILHCNIAVALTPLDVLVQKRSVTVAKLEGLIAQYEAHPEKVRPVLKLKNGKVAMCGGKDEVDGITFVSQELSALNDEVVTMQALGVKAEVGVSGNRPSSMMKLLSRRVRSVVVKSSIDSPKKEEDYAAVVTVDDAAVLNADGVVTDVEQGDVMAEDTNLKMKEESVKTDAADSADSESAPEDKTKIAATCTGFVTFKTLRSQVIACQVPILSEQHVKVFAIPAPAPMDIIWDNVGARPAYTKQVAYTTSIVYTAGLLFWGVVMAFIAAISNLSNLAKYLTFVNSLDPVSYAVLAGQLPVIVLIVFLALLPMIMTFVAQSVEKRKTISGVQQEVFKWFFMYQLANVFLILLAGSVFDSLTDAINDPASIITLIGTALPSVSVFFINYTITALFSGVPGVLLNIVKLLIFRLYRLIFKEAALTRRTMVQGPLGSDSVNYGTTLPNFLYILCIMLLYWVIAPILLVVSTLFFGASYVAWKYQYLYVVVRAYESGGVFFYGLYKYSMIGLLCGNVTMIAFMGIKQGAAQTPLLVPLLVLIVYSWRYTESQFLIASMNLPYSAAVDVDTDKRHEELLATFTENFNKQPNLTQTNKAFPYPYRINNTPLFDKTGVLSSVYHSDTPEGVDLQQDMQRYALIGSEREGTESVSKEIEMV